MDGALLAAFATAGADLARLGLAPPGGGNLSVWTPAGIVITREGAWLDRLSAADLCLIARATEPPAATPSMDTPIHRAIYVSVQARGVVHARPAHAVALTLDAESFTPPDVTGRHRLGEVPVISPRRNIVQLVAEALATAPVVIARAHGCYARGASLAEAVEQAALLEHSARIAWLAGGRPAQ